MNTEGFHAADRVSTRRKAVVAVIPEGFHAANRVSIRREAVVAVIPEGSHAAETCSTTRTVADVEKVSKAQKALVEVLGDRYPAEKAAMPQKVVSMVAVVVDGHRTAERVSTAQKAVMIAQPRPTGRTPTTRGAIGRWKERVRRPWSTHGPTAPHEIMNKTIMPGAARGLVGPCLSRGERWSGPAAAECAMATESFIRWWCVPSGWRKTGFLGASWRSSEMCVGGYTFDGCTFDGYTFGGCTLDSYMFDSYTFDGYTFDGCTFDG